MSIFSFLFPSKVEAPAKDKWNTNYSYVFVHGLMGWGEYDTQYKLMPYWGMFGGELLGKLEDKGYNCYAASVSGTASAWDRACELYAQLTGTVVDYGKAHSEKCGHNRYGKDFTGKALIEKWDSENKINLLGHSFGGATMRVFESLMAKGDETEIVSTAADEIGMIKGTTSGGYVVDESWFENDGLVNTVSAKAPSYAPSTEFDKDNITPGIWNIMPVYQGDHMSLQGGFFKVNTDVERLYTEHFDMINRIA